MAGGVDMIFQKEFEDLGVNIGFMAIRNTPASRGFWEYVHSEISRTQALDQRVVNNSLYSGHAAEEFGLRWDRWPSEIWASSMAFSGPLPEGLLVHHANFLLEKAPSADPGPKLEQLKLLQAQTPTASPATLAAWSTFLAAAREAPAMHDYRSRHFGERRPGPVWATLPECHVAYRGGYSEKAAKKAAKEAQAVEQ
ncbi:Sulfate transporter 4.1 [Durusdinium trenchii]|uniref:Chloroplastic n=1 Tax=Durusdinium trenchii TaxID=1381693 RepID=A0ABP0R952_9DINO